MTVTVKQDSTVSVFGDVVHVSASRSWIAGSSEPRYFDWSERKTIQVTLAFEDYTEKDRDMSAGSIVKLRPIYSFHDKRQVDYIIARLLSFDDKEAQISVELRYEEKA